MIGVGIIGLGTVGIGTYKILREHKSLIKQRTGIDIEVVRIADIDIGRDRGIPLEKDLLTRDAREVIQDDRVDMVVELMGGLDPAHNYITEALNRKKWVVTANKALLAERGAEIFSIAKKEGCEVGFEASVCGGIPVIGAIRNSLVGNRLSRILGILNGTCNYILTQMTDEGISFGEALKQAQDSGFAEKDPTLDIEGIDAAHKLCILIRLAFHYPVAMEDITTAGISKIEPIDIQFAREFGYRIKLLGTGREENGLIEARVGPAMIPLAHPMSNVGGVFNAAYVIGDKVGPTLYYGRGAGSDPTGSAVVSDIVDMAQRLKAGTPRLVMPLCAGDRRMRTSEESSFPCYMRFTVEDRPGVLSRISGILAESDISISSVIQKEGKKESGHVSLVILTHEAVEKNLKKARAEIDMLPFIKGESIHIGIEEGNS
ncbi:MAG: homoserine dehydrogenase [Syntrophobacterales bacterium]|jgi:homoserine dehydrogenase|nr:homoserine dehydrogenase [Syntrophobacterales bacterium]